MSERNASIGLGPLQAPPRAFAFHPVLHDGTARRLHDAGSDGQAHRQLCVVLHPAPVVLEAGDDVRERLPYRLPQPSLREERAQTADDVTHSAAQHGGQLRLHPRLSAPGAFGAQGIGRGPQGAHHGYEVEDRRHALPRLAALGRQVPQAEGAIEQDDQRLVVLGYPGAPRRP